MVEARGLDLTWWDLNGPRLASRHLACWDAVLPPSPLLG